MSYEDQSHRFVITGEDPEGLYRAKTRCRVCDQVFLRLSQAARRYSVITPPSTR
jgi:hypothetical protein